MQLIQPTLLLDKKRAIRNIEMMTTKARRSGVIFRPHFKTHQSAAIGGWFREASVDRITVSSLDMALYFAKNGWRNITVAFPVNLPEINKINRLAEKIELHLLVESTESVKLLEQQLRHPVHLWIKIDTGYHRTGIEWDNFTKILQVAETIERAEKISLQGLLTHSGHSYRAKSTAEIREIYSDTVLKLKSVKDRLASAGINEVKISIGDTPTCSVVENFEDVDEIRPGNFVFYDVMQLRLGSCSEHQIAVGLACPVVARHQQRNEIVIYGGAIHLSKEFLMDENDTPVFGFVCRLRENGWAPIAKSSYVSALSQEHGIIKADSDFFEQVKIGDILVILPVHSCLTANLMKRYRTLDGAWIESMQSQIPDFNA
jgi:D-serine deaminase-like pyridoxal phosphate-dependent protein